ncbi:MAG: hypothetical protein GXY83_40790 [Rhodopirellula sp.]|nr:hypothetical protein [Rhodopirellula sp.]
MPRVLLIFATALFAASLCPPLDAHADGKIPRHSLRSRRSPDAIDRIQAKLEVGGDLTVVEEGDLKRLKMSVVGDLDYFERSLAVSTTPETPLRSIRHYQQVSAAIQIEDNRFAPALPEDRRLIGVEVDDAAITLFSPRGPLTRDNLDLIDLQGNSLLLDRLLPNKSVAVGDAWKHSDALVAAMLRLEEVSKTQVESKLVSVRDGAALVEMSGTVNGAIQGVSTEIELKAKYQFALKAGRVTWLGLLIKEKRSIGHIGTGLDVVARLQMTVTPGATAEALSDKSLTGLALSPTPELSALVHRSSKGTWELGHDRRWFITSESADGLALRMVDRGELVAQCNVATVETAGKTKPVSLDTFQKDIQRVLGKSFGQFIKAAERSDEAGNRVYRVEAQGDVENLPILWIYYLITHPDGRRVSLAFTMEGALFDQFEQSDESIISTFRFLPSNVADRSVQTTASSPAATTAASPSPAPVKSVR